ncbi:uncharacterized protein [Lolium perenne]|uniref:uncharacterized protein n=1 Tax=Lolium perenne TaxID=4522 RepID=UPI0021F5C106|nr:uncharacterized protein LOC127340391 [Lolium perenne]
MALVFRFVDKDGILQERFFDLIHVTSTKAATLKEVLSSVLSQNAFDVQNLRGQGYDGASNMRGEFNGLQALFLRECPYAYYVHFYAHRLQLALVGASKEVVPVAQFFQKLLFIVNTVDSSAKRHDEIHDAQLDELARLLAIDEIETGQASDGSAGSIRADGDTAFIYLSSFEFILVLCLMQEILEITEDLGQALQKKSQDIVNAMRLVFSTKIWRKLIFYAVVVLVANLIVSLRSIIFEWKSFKADDICEMVKKYYPSDFTQQEIYGLEQQLKHFVVDASNDKELKNIVKTRLRNKMEDEFLANSLLVNIEREIAEKYNYEDILEHFSGKKRRSDL